MSDNNAMLDHYLIDTATPLIDKRDPVLNPHYYRDGKIEVADFIADKNLNFFLGNVVKYIARAGKKDPLKYLEDLNKALWYLTREIKRVSDNAAGV